MFLLGVNPLFGVGQKKQLVTWTSHSFFLNKSLLQNESSWLKGLLDRQSVKKFQGHLSFSSSHIYKRLFSLRFAPLYDWPYPSVVGEENISEKLAPSIFYSKSIFSTCSLKG
jgi:hypothetical protein